jgi:phosphoglucomutase
MSGMLIAEYILRERLANGTMPKNPALVTTIVTTNMAHAVTQAYGVKEIDTLTGFKYIGEQIHIFEQTGKHNYVFGLEESYGCLAGTHARDKDAVVAVMCLAEVAAYCKKLGITLWDMMMEMYDKYGYYKETQYAITKKGKEGLEEIAQMMEKLRNDPPRAFGDLKVKEFRDYKMQRTVNIETGEEGKTDLPVSNVLYFDLENDSWCCARPSGTEPKIKFYMGIKGTDLLDAQQRLDALTEAVKSFI